MRWFAGTGPAAVVVFGFSVKEGLLVGGILSATDGAAVFALLRGSRVPARLARTLEGEAAVFFGEQLVVGGVVGVVVGRLAAPGCRGPGRPVEAGAGAGRVLLAVYVAGLSLGDVELAERPGLLAFHEGLASVAEIGPFLALGLLVFPSQLGDVWVKGVLLAVIVAFVARPVAPGVATVGSGLSRGERVVLGWAGLRGDPDRPGDVPDHRGRAGSLEFLNIVFLVVLLSAVAQGTTVEPLARRLGVIGRGPG